MEGSAEAAPRDAIEAKMRGGDYTGARTLLLQTLQTNPMLENAFEMLSVLEVLCAAGMTATLPGRGAVDWYRILQVLPGDAAAKIEARYRSLIVELEPVRDDLPCADLALGLVEDAYAVLSDPAKRARFDSKNTAGSIKSMASSNAHVELRSDGILTRKGLHVEGDARLNGVDGSASYSAIPEVDRSNSIDAEYIQQTASCLDAGNCSNIASSSQTKRTDPCSRGDGGGLQLPDDNHVDKKQKFLYEKDEYCVLSSEMDFDGCFTDPLDAKQDEHCSSKHYDYHNFEDDRSIEHFANGQVWAAYDWEKLPHRYARISKVLTDKMQLYVSWFKPCPQSHEENKWLSACLPFVCGSFVAEEGQMSLTCPTMFCHQILTDNLKQDLEVYPQKGEVWAIYSDWDIGWCSNPEMRKKSAFSVVEILTSYSKSSGCTVANLVKVDGLTSVFRGNPRSGREELLHNLLMFSHRIPSFRFTHEAGTMLELEHSTVPENLQHESTLASVAPLSPLASLRSGTHDFSGAPVARLSNPSTSRVDSGIPQMDYNNKLSPDDFVEGQIWAVYDSRDRMPRSYVRIVRVVSHTAVSVLKLEPHPMLNEEIRWVEDGLPVACGVFRAGTETTYKDMSEFSHPVECDWSAKRSFYRIFPKKGEIWAMYKNWKITLNSTDIDKCEPHMVEILSDYSDENGVNACRLNRVKGCLSFFQRVLLEDFHLTRWVSRSEMLSFSHRVPAFVVIGIKERAIPQGSWHLEPNALPLRTIH